MSDTLPVTNPRTGEVDYHVPNHDAGHVAAVAAELRQHQRAWEAAGLAHRSEVLKAWRGEIAARSEAITAALAMDTGRFLMASIETSGTLARIDHWVREAPRILGAVGGGTSGMAPSVSYSYRLKPYPVVGVISPWNVPLTLGLIDAMPALIGGAAILLKPSEVTPRFAEPLAESIAAVPELAGVLKIVTGGAETGKALIDHVDAVCFTGSVETGRKVAVHAAERFIPAFLELGGKDPAIVLESADLENAANAILRSAAGLTGQACQSLERIYVARGVFEAFVDRLADKAAAVRVNYPDIHAGQIGPFIFPPQGAKVQAQIDEAVAKGAKVLCGGQVENLGGGQYLLPTVMIHVDHSMALMREETFGPVLPVMPFDSVDEAVGLANDSDFGLSAAVFAGSREEGEAVAERIHAGGVSVNDASLTAFVHDVEKNAFCLSGMGGSRMGDAGLTRFFRKQSIMFQSAPAAPIAMLEEAQCAPGGGDD